MLQFVLQHNTLPEQLSTEIYVRRCLPTDLSLPSPKLNCGSNLFFVINSLSMAHVKGGVALLDAANACAAGAVVLESIADSLKLTSTQKRNINTLCEAIKKTSEVVIEHTGAACGASAYAQQRLSAERRKKLRVKAEHHNLSPEASKEAWIPSNHLPSLLKLLQPR
jgi:hypothetical protein